MKTAITKITRTVCKNEAEVGRLFCQALTKYMHEGFNLVKIENDEVQLELRMFQLRLRTSENMLEITEHSKYHGSLEDVMNKYVIDEEMTVIFLDADSAELAEDKVRVYLARL